ncbi:MAG: MBL fold metallo-hydrolase [Myxococcota bacterium]|nr:MBL fold metallo-hydrolase [Myxococcota bacterium]
MPPPLYVRQLQLGTMDNFVYLVGAEGAAEVAVIDPAWDVPAIERAAAEDGKVITAAFASHCHHDHINGVPELLSRHDIPLYAQREEIAFSPELRRIGDAVRPLDPGQQVRIGPLAVRALHTPGHTPGSQCLQVGDAVVSGDTVFVGRCGRCDLNGGDPEAMHRSITQVLMKLPEATRLLPGHNYGEVPSSNIGREKDHNPYFQFADVADFVAFRMKPRK